MYCKPDTTYTGYVMCGGVLLSEQSQFVVMNTHLNVSLCKVLSS